MKMKEIFIIGIAKFASDKSGGSKAAKPWTLKSGGCLLRSTRSTQPCIPLGSLNRVSALIGWGKGGNVTSAG